MLKNQVQFDDYYQICQTKYRFEMWRRVRVYFIGLLLGCLVTWMMLLRDRNLDDYLKWTPNQRVLSEFSEDSLFVPSDAFWCHLQCQGFNSKDYRGLLDEGKVLFSESTPRQTPKMYRIEFETEKRGTLILDFEIGEEKKRIVQVRKEGEETPNCSCPNL